MTENYEPQLLPPSNAESYRVPELPVVTPSPTSVPSVPLVIPSQVVNPIRVSLVGKIYTVQPIKGYVGLLLSARLRAFEADVIGATQVIDEIVETMFSPEDAEDVLRRMRTATDPLDVPHIFELIPRVAELSTGNPTM